MPEIVTRGAGAELSYQQGDEQISWQNLEVSTTPLVLSEVHNRTILVATVVSSLTLPVAATLLAALNTVHTSAVKIGWRVKVINNSSGDVTIDAATNGVTLQGAPDNILVNQLESVEISLDAIDEEYFLVGGGATSIDKLDPTVENNAVIQNDAGGLKDAGVPLASVDVTPFPATLPATNDGNAQASVPHGQTSWDSFTMHLVPKAPAVLAGFTDNSQIPITTGNMSGGERMTFEVEPPGGDVNVILDGGIQLYSPGATPQAVDLNQTNFGLVVVFTDYTVLP